MFVLLFCGIVIFYSIYLMFASVTFWVGRFSAFPSLFNILSIPLSVPLDIYGKNATLFLTYILPLAFVVTIPAQVLLGKLEPAYVGLGIFFACLGFYLATLLWNRALLNYSSASS
jgi:ABC-2 type transport system permease protein